MFHVSTPPHHMDVRIQPIFNRIAYLSKTGYQTSDPQPGTTPQPEAIQDFGGNFSAMASNI